MRIFCAAAFLLIATPTLACTAGGRPCDDVFRDQLRSIDQTRTENMNRDSAIKERQHQERLRAIQRQRELDAARGAPPVAPAPLPAPTIPATTTAGNPTPNAG